MSASERMAGLVEALWGGTSPAAARRALLAAIADLEARNAALTEALKNAEALALRAEVAEMSARSREADAARVALGAANGETLLRAAQRVAGDAKMGAIALRVKARLTVGAALAIGNVIEFQASWTDDLTWIQIKCGERWRMWRTRAGESWWSMWTTPLNLDGVDRARPARLVPLSLADLDPATRGEMP